MAKAMQRWNQNEFMMGRSLSSPVVWSHFLKLKAESQGNTLRVFQLTLCPILGHSKGTEKPGRTGPLPYQIENIRTKKFWFPGAKMKIT